MTLLDQIAAVNAAGFTIICLKQYNRANHSQWWALLEDYDLGVYEAYANCPEDALALAMLDDPSTPSVEVVDLSTILRLPPPVTFRRR